MQRVMILGMQRVAVGDLFENQGHCRDLGFVFYFLIQEEHW